MKVNCDSKELKKALATIRPAVPSAAEKADYITLRTEDDYLIIESMNYLAGIICMQSRIKAEIAEHGHISVRFSTLNRFLNKSGTIIIENQTGSDTLVYEQNYLKCETQCKPYTPIPLSQIETQNKQIFNAEHLKILDTVRLFCASDASRPVLGGVFIHFDGKTERFVSADGFRLLISEFNSKLPEEASIIIPNNICKLVAKLSADVQMEWDSKMVKFSNETTTICANLIQGSFPKYTELLPKIDPTWTISCSGLELKTCLDCTDGLIARLTPSDNNLLITINNAVHNENFTALIPAEMTGKDKVALSLQYLKELTKIFDPITLHVFSFNQPVLITGQNGLKALQMPMFVSWD